MITIVIGKPGTGKTYHTVRYLTKYLTTVARKKDAKRVVYTNISLNLDALQDYFDRWHIKINVKERVKLLGPDDLRFRDDLLKEGEVREEKRGARRYNVIAPSSQAFFWNRFQEDAFIIIDEIQKYIGSVKEYGESEEQSLVEYFSLHRHKRHDWIFLTQSLMSLSLVVRRVSERVIEVFNSKSMTLPFPISIPVQDIFTVLRAFGVTSQLYRVREGLLEGSYKCVFDGPLEVVKMSPEIYALYKTHTQAESESDGSDSELPFDLGRGAWHRAIRWFIFKHAPHLLLKSIVAFLICFLGYGFIKEARAGFHLQDLAKSVVDSSSENFESTSNTPSEVASPLVDVVSSSASNSDMLSNNENDFDSAENIEDSTEQKPISRIAIFGDCCFINGRRLRVGDLYREKRIVSIDTRFGVRFENASSLYLRDFASVANCERWLRSVTALDSLSAASDVARLETIEE